MDLCIDLIRYLVSLGIPLEEAVDTFVGTMPKAPDNVTTFKEYVGTPLNDGTMASFRRVQCKARGKDSIEVYNRVFAIYNLLLGTQERRFEDRWFLVFVLDTPIEIDIDAQERHIWSFNISVTTINKEVI